MPKNTQKCKGYEVFQRLNYLFQIKDVMSKNGAVSSYYGNLFTNIAKKSVLKIDPGLKRQICKKCKGALIPGQTVNVRIKRKHKKQVVTYKCNQCGFIKNYPILSNKKVWTETKESVVGVIDAEGSSNVKNTEGNGKNKKQDKNKGNAGTAK